ncbi:unnamed protein product [Ambrosiozyma monospora]|uniref:Unnamed protein product n=1 Tax=Ambrosiozyma monospora TaxID=43982 RepID=A0ACB5U389_AMBMO|nr:unnamed protein product [Ambrosiozyma monospora]
MASTKALCKERYDDWLAKFGPLSCSVGLLTGDASVSETERAKKSDIIICTPEKWDALTRRWFDYSKLFELVRLLLIDEIHTLGDQRGTSLEVVTTRMKTMKKDLRIVALSATLPNINDISDWLYPKDGDSPSTLVFGDEYRAVKLKRTVYGYKTAGTSNDFQFDSFLNGKLSRVLEANSKRKPTLIFCPTRSSCINTCKSLSKNMTSIFGSFNNTSTYKNVNKELYNLIVNGIAFHHAGLSMNDRLLVEQGFKRGDIKVLCLL